jgi:hypothetical protein
MTLRERAYSAVLEERDALRAELAAARQEAERLRETNRRLNRRCQEATAAAPAWQEIAATKRANRSIGKGLLSYGLHLAKEENDALRARLDRAEALLREARFVVAEQRILNMGVGWEPAHPRLLARIKAHLTPTGDAP